MKENYYNFENSVEDFFKKKHHFSKVLKIRRLRNGAFKIKKYIEKKITKNES